MCGITGFVNISFTKTHIEQMTSCLSHRGPNAEGYFIDEVNGVGLGHRRLSILDLSDTANQPFYSDDKRYIIVFNGEVYNFQEIKQKLSSRTWKTTGDTEVILAAYQEWGKSCVEHFNGMFAFVIYDTLENKLFLCRDRIGVKPLYYYHKDDIFIFASEIKAIKAIQPLSINYSAIANYLYIGYTPAQQSFYEHLYKFPAGCVGVFQNNKLYIEPYWKLENKILPQTVTDFEEAKKQLVELLQSSISYRLISDVPVGIFLSGGTDSSIITALAKRVSTSSVNTFSIGFRETQYNEAPFARRVAEYLKTNHQEFILHEDDALDLIDKIINWYDQPFSDSSCIPTYLVSQMASKYVRVALSGDGGDELFMGYGMYKWAARLNNPFFKNKNGRNIVAYLLQKSWSNKYKRASHVFDYTSKERIKSHIFSQDQYFFTHQEIKKLLSSKQDSTLTLDEEINTSARKLTPKEQQSFFDIKNYLKDDLLVKVDIASMQHGLEVREPLLDYRLVEFALNVDEKLKVKGDEFKFLLKQVLYDFIPQKYFDRPKWGFSIPLRIWLKNKLRGRVENLLSKEIVNECKIVKYEEVKELKERFFRKKEDYLYNRIWTLMILHQWLVKELTHTYVKSPV